jgi:UDP-N-acetylmuramoyl-L-alanyl-D-glutamate--2,6-diaminopimelate ligase
MQLSELIKGIPGKVYNMQDIDIKSVEFDSKQVTSGSLYIALKGMKHDGHSFVRDAESRGAVAVVVEKPVDTQLTQVMVNDSRAVLHLLARRFYGPFADLIKVGITGTNGKTTTAFLIRSVLAHAGYNPGLIGTVFYWGRSKTKARHTTPEILDTYKIFKKFKDENIDSVVMEVSSHALTLGRVEDIRFDIVVFTNISQDHLDFHRTMGAYLKAKLHLLALLGSNGRVVYNNDDKLGQEIKRLKPPSSISFGMSSGCDVQGRLMSDALSGLMLEITHENERYEVRSQLVGTYNAYNILAAFATGVALNILPVNIIDGIEAVGAVRGRMERVVDDIFVDFAHTPSAIENILLASRKYVQGRLIIVFGCGGDRDVEKRAQMGSLATRLADFTVVTSDNPRSEPPLKIIGDIKQGIRGNNYKVIPDRKAAIEHAISLKNQGDMVIIAGKGHEEYQVINEQMIEFDDAEVVRQCFANTC